MPKYGYAAVVQVEGKNGGVAESTVVFVMDNLNGNGVDAILRQVRENVLGDAESDRLSLKQLQFIGQVHEAAPGSPKEPNKETK